MNRRSRSRIGWVLSLSLLGLSGSAHAGDLKSPFALENAATLPRGVRNPRFINVFTSVTQRFAGDGSVEPLGQPLNKPITWNDVLGAQEDDGKRATVGGLIRKTGLDLGGGPGSSSGEVNTFATVRVAALAVGITDRFTLAGALPIVNVDVSASTGFVRNADGAAFIQAAASDSSPLVADEAARKLNDPVNQKLTRLGYKPIQASEKISGVGDFQLIGKYRVFDDGVNGVALKGSVIFPTGIAPDPDKALDVPTGDGRYGAAVGAVYDRRLPWDLRLNTYASYTALLPRRIVKRIPTSVSDALSADKEELEEGRRDQLQLGTGVDHLFASTGITLGGGYAFQYQTRADYRPGTRVAEDRYSLLGDLQPHQALHSVLVSAGFSTVEWYRQKRFVYPFQVNLSYSYPLEGRNVTANELFAGELVLFF